MKSIDFLGNSGTALRKRQGEHVFRQGEYNRSLFVVRSGLIKAYYLSVDGKEHVKSLISSGDFVGSLTSCHAGQACSFSLVCLEDTELIEVGFDQLRDLALANPVIAEFITEGLLELAMKKERREFEFLCLSAEERYQLLCEREPLLVQKVTQNDIARYLGITPVALSRIKKRLKKQHPSILSD